MLKTYSQSVRANTKDLPCVNCQLMYEVLEEYLREGREGAREMRGAREMGGARGWEGHGDETGRRAREWEG